VGLRAQFDLAGETQDVADDGVKTAHRAGDLLGQGPFAGTVGQIVAEHLGVEPDRAQRVADLVRDAGRHLAQRRQAPAAFELLVGALEFALEPGDLGGQRLVRAGRPRRSAPRATAGGGARRR